MFSLLFLSESQAEECLFDQWREEDKRFIITRACKQVENKIESHNVVVVTGHLGSGKSAIVQHIALKYKNKGWIVKFVTRYDKIVEECTISENHSNNNNILLVMNDPVGKTIFNECLYHLWEGNKELLNSVLKKVKLLLSCRKSVFYDHRTQEMFESGVAIVDIDNLQCMLTNEEKRQILKIHVSDINFTESDLSEILKTGSHFPLSCKMFGSNKKYQKNDAVTFFTQPLGVFKDEIRSFRKCDKEKYCALVLLVFFDNKLRIDDLLKKENKFQHALKLCGISLNTSPYSFRDNLELLNGFLVKNISGTYQFYHDFAMDVTCLVIGSDYPEEIINNADIGFLQRRVRLNNSSDQNDPFMMYINDDNIHNLVNRFFIELFEERFLGVVFNPCFQDVRVIGLFKKEIDQHSEKIQLLLKKKTPKVENLELTKISDNVLERVEFMKIEKEISPLFVLILFCHTDISLYCLQTLSQAQANFKESKLFSAVCSNGSNSLFKTFSNECVKDSLKEMWGDLSPIHIVSLFHNFEIMKELICLGADVNMLTQDEKKWSPLMQAVTTDYNENSDKYNHSNISRRDETVLLLLKNGANINVCNKDGMNSLHIACQNGHEKIVQRLINNEADINCSSINGTIPLFEACKHERYNILANKADVNICTKDGESPLFIACENGYNRIVQHLLDNEANITSCERSRESHISLSRQKEYNGIAQSFVSKCAIINLCNCIGASPLYKACKNNHNSTVELLLKKGADINLCKKNGTSPLYIACQNGNESLVNILLDNKADINLCTEDGTSPLYIACQEGNESLVQLLLDKGADINQCTKDGTSPLYIACQKGYESLIQLLLDNEADTNLCIEDGTSPLYIACNAGNNSIVRILIIHKAEVNLCRRNGASPLYAACQNNHYSTVIFLLCNRANINLCTETGTSPLFIACENENEDVSNALIDNDANLNLCKIDKTSPLAETCYDGNETLVDLLLNGGADVNLCRKDGTSPLLIALQKENEILAQKLLDKGADSNLCRKDKTSPHSAVCQNGNESLVKCLLNKGADINLCTKKE